MDRATQLRLATVVRAGQTVYLREKQEDGTLKVVDTYQGESIGAAKRKTREFLKKGGFSIVIQSGEVFDARS